MNEGRVALLGSSDGEGGGRRNGPGETEKMPENSHPRKVVEMGLGGDHEGGGKRRRERKRRGKR